MLAEQDIKAANTQPRTRDQLVAALNETADQQSQQNGTTPAPNTPAPNAAPVQRKQTAGGDAGDNVDIHATAQRGVSGSGSRLPHEATIQRAFGRHDLGGVQAHVGGEAATASRALGAEAFAHGNSIAFKGQPDLHTAAHEAAHVIQQRGGGVPAGMDNGPGDPLEQHADRVADAVVSGGSAEALLDPMAGGTGGTPEAAVQRIPDKSEPAHHAHHGHKAHRATDEEVMANEHAVDGAAIDAASAKYDVPATEIRAIITQESRGNADANAGAKQKDKGKHAASGLMQVTAETWKQAQHEHPDLAQYDFATYRYDRRVNILVGTSVLASKRRSLTKMGIDGKGPQMAALTAMAYNAGQGLVEDAYRNAVAGGSKDPDADCLKAQYLKPAIQKRPEIYSYYLTGGGKSRNKERTVEGAVELKFKEISGYPSHVSNLVAEDARAPATHGPQVAINEPADQRRPQNGGVPAPNAASAPVQRKQSSGAASIQRKSASDPASPLAGNEQVGAGPTGANQTATGAVKSGTNTEHKESLGAEIGTQLLEQIIDKIKEKLQELGDLPLKKTVDNANKELDEMETSCGEPANVGHLAQEIALFNLGKLLRDTVSTLRDMVSASRELAHGGKAVDFVKSTLGSSKSLVDSVNEFNDSMRELDEKVQKAGAQCEKEAKARIKAKTGTIVIPTFRTINIDGGNEGGTHSVRLPPVTGLGTSGGGVELHIGASGASAGGLQLTATASPTKQTIA